MLGGTVLQESLAGRKFGEFGESQVIHQTKIIQTLQLLLIYNAIRQIF